MNGCDSSKACSKAQQSEDVGRRVPSLPRSHQKPTSPHTQSRHTAPQSLSLFCVKRKNIFFLAGRANIVREDLLNFTFVFEEIILLMIVSKKRTAFIDSQDCLRTEDSSKSLSFEIGSL